MKIPRQFELLGHTITVEYDQQLLHKDNCLGLAVYRDNKIILQPSTDDNPLPKEKALSYFCHELMHFLLFFAEQDDLRQDEKAVNLMGNLLMQFLKTKKDVETIKIIESNWE